MKEAGPAFCSYPYILFYNSMMIITDQLHLSTMITDNSAKIFTDKLYSFVVIGDKSPKTLMINWINLRQLCKDLYYPDKVNFSLIIFTEL